MPCHICVVYVGPAPLPFMILFVVERRKKKQKERKGKEKITPQKNIHKKGK